MSEVPQQLRTTTEDAFTPITKSAIHDWAQAWGYTLPDGPIGASSRTELRSRLTALIRHIKVSIVNGLGQRGVSMDEKDDAGRTALHLAIDAGYGDDTALEDEVESDQTITALLKWGSRPDIAYPKGPLPLDLTIGRGQWSAAEALVARNAPSAVLSSLETAQFTTAFGRLSLRQPKPTRSLSMSSEPEWISSYHPQSPLDIYHTAFFLRQCLKQVSKQASTQQSRATIVKLILDFAQYWTKTSDTIDKGDKFRKPSRGALRTTVVIGKGHVQKLELTVYFERYPSGRAGGHHRPSSSSNYLFSSSDSYVSGTFSHGRSFASAIPAMRNRYRSPLGARPSGVDPVSNIRESSILDLTCYRARHPRQTREQTVPVPSDKWVRSVMSPGLLWTRAWLRSFPHDTGTALCEPLSQSS